MNILVLLAALFASCYACNHNYGAYNYLYNSYTMTYGTDLCDKELCTDDSMCENGSCYLNFCSDPALSSLVWFIVLVYIGGSITCCITCCVFAYCAYRDTRKISL